MRRSFMKRMEKRLQPFEQVNRAPTKDEIDVSIVCGWIKATTSQVPIEYKMLTLDQMIAKTYRIVRKMASSIPDIKVRRMPQIEISTGWPKEGIPGHVAVRVRLFVPKKYQKKIPREG